jgi:hypothetical protein
LHNKFFATLPGIVLHCVFKVFPFTLVICVYVHLKKTVLLFILFCVFFFNTAYSSTDATASLFQFFFCMFSSLFPFQVRLLYKLALESRDAVLEQHLPG